MLLLCCEISFLFIMELVTLVLFQGSRMGFCVCVALIQCWKEKS